MLKQFIEIALIFLPAFIGNALPVIAKNIPGIRFLSRPIHERHLGKNKTYRGLISGIFGGMVAGFGLHALVLSMGLSVDFPRLYDLYGALLSSLFFGSFLGFSALVGDMIKSFFKRKLGVKPGSMFQPWDGIDYIVASMILITPWITFSLTEVIFLLLLGPVLSLVSNIFAYIIGWKDVWY